MTGALKAPHSAGCVTRKDPRLKAWWASTAPEGTPCVFGVDARDEGSHCVAETLYGSNGWCFTSADQSTWGSCGDTCPLFGPNKILGQKLHGVGDQIHALKEKVEGSKVAGVGTNSTASKAAGADAQPPPTAAPTVAPADSKVPAKSSSMLASSVIAHTGRGMHDAAPAADAKTPDAGDGNKGVVPAGTPADGTATTPAADVKAADDKAPAAGNSGEAASNLTAIASQNSSVGTQSSSATSLPSSSVPAQNQTEVPVIANQNACITRKDPRATAWWSITSSEGTPCVFGVDSRDEGSHCIHETAYGSNGWCFTSADLSSWGSCGDSCPLFGPNKILGAKIDSVAKQIGNLTDKVGGADAKRPVMLGLKSLRNPIREANSARASVVTKRVALVHLPEATKNSRHAEATTFPGFMLLQKSSALREIEVKVTKDAFQKMEL